MSTSTAVDVNMFQMSTSTVAYTNRTSLDNYMAVYFNCRMPNCTTVVQTASDLFEPQIPTKFARKMTLFGPLSD